MLKRSLIFSFLLITSLTLTAQINPIKFYRDSLENGLQIIYCPDNSAPVVATVLHYKVGSKNEISSQTGYAHFFEHLMFEATESIPRASIDKYVQEAGGELNAHTSFDETVYYFKLPSNQLNLALWIESQRMRKLKLDTIGVETQRGVVLEEMKQTATNQPYGTLFRKLMENLFSGTPYGWEVLGYEKHIATAKIEDFKNFYDEFYQPNNAILVITGDFDIIQTRETIRKYFDQYPRKIVKHNNLEIPPLQKPIRETINDDKAQLPGIFISFRAPSKNDSDYYALQLLTNIMANGKSSRLYKRIISNEQKAVETSIMYMPLKYSGVFMVYAIASMDADINEVETILKEEIQKIIDQGVTEKELQKAKNNTETEFAFANKNVLDKAEALAEYLSYYGDPELINSEIDKFLNVTIDDIKKVAKKYLATDKNVTLIYLPNNK